MKRLVTILIAAAVLGGCVQYRLIEPERREIGNFFSVEPQIEWSASSEGKLEVWTVNSPLLEAVYFAKGLSDGDVLFKAPLGQDKQKRPRFRKHVTANEVMEFVVDSMSVEGAGKVEAGGLRPARFGERAGFRFELSFLTQEGLEKQGLAIGTVADDKLYLILYLGAREHYFATYKDAVERLIDSIETL